jgi:hypothetical protein
MRSAIINDYGPASPHETARQAGRPRVRRLLSNRSSGWIVAAVLMCAVIGLSIGLATSPSATAGHLASGSGFPAAGGSGGGLAGGGGSSGGGSNARSGPAPGGAAGTVASVSASSFTMSTSGGQKVSISTASFTTYQKGTSSASASALTNGEPVLVFGWDSGTTITATQVIVQPTGSGASATSSTSKVVQFKRGKKTTTKKVGQIPANWNQGSGTIVSGTAANNATEVALAAYPGAIVDRVVKISNGEYNVHYIGDSWPHHVFVNQDFKVVGAEG